MGRLTVSWIIVFVKSCSQISASDSKKVEASVHFLEGDIHPMPTILRNLGRRTEAAKKSIPLPERGIHRHGLPLAKLPILGTDKGKSSIRQKCCRWDDTKAW